MRTPDWKSRRSGASYQQEPALSEPVFAWRLLVVATCFLAAIFVVLWRVVELQVFEREFLGREGELRTLRSHELLASRGTIYDRHGEPLAISAPAYTIHANPQDVNADADKMSALAVALDMPVDELASLLDPEGGRRFVYLARQVSPEMADAVQTLRIPGVFAERGYKRFYPAGEVTAHLVGFTDIDEKGQEGLELAFDQVLQGEPGARKVMIDARRQTIKNLGIERPRRGQDLYLSIDLRLQYYAYRELKAAVQAHKAKAGTLVLLDVPTGQILAMANQPGFNPNNRASLKPDAVRNRAVTDVFEPGSTVKPLTIAAALRDGVVSASTQLKTSPGFIRLNGRTVRDLHDYGTIDVATVLRKSSNVGTTRIALKTGGDAVRGVFYDAGLGQVSGTGFPGESVGRLPSYTKWKPINLAAMSYGYGLSVTALQLAQAYAMLANDGERLPVTLLRDGGISQPAERVLPAEVARTVARMLEAAASEKGTGARAQTTDYRVAGKTGTAHQVGSHGYEGDKYLAVFAGFAPASRPRLAMVVVISAPQAGEYYGGEVAAPVFSRVMASALRVLNEVPDRSDRQVVQSSGSGRGHG